MKTVIKKNLNWILITSIITLLPLLVGFILWGKLPDQLPMHFNINGNVDNYSGKLFGVIFAPIFLLVMQWFIIIVCSLDIKLKSESDISNKIFHIVLFIMPCTSIYIAVLVYGTSLGIK